jgi:predicted neutral ceramidase superfamily lipid hydrolase
VRTAPRGFFLPSASAGARSSFSLGSESKGLLGLRRARPERRKELPSSHRLPLFELLFLLIELLFDELLDGRASSSLIIVTETFAIGIRLLWLEIKLENQIKPKIFLRFAYLIGFSSSELLSSLIAFRTGGAASLLFRAFPLVRSS